MVPAQLILLVHNLLNVWLDAYKIKVHKTIRHGINFGAYAATFGLLAWLYRLETLEALQLALSAFFQRQLAFDIPLNLRRGLPWDYISTANPPKAILDRLEKLAFGKYARYSYHAYALLYLGTIFWSATTR